MLTFETIIFKGSEIMPEKWTGELIGRMQNNKITYDKLAK